jgi:hypothetical protein
VAPTASNRRNRRLPGAPVARWGWTNAMNATFFPR